MNNTEWTQYYYALRNIRHTGLHDCDRTDPFSVDRPMLCSCETDMRRFKRVRVTWHCPENGRKFFQQAGARTLIGGRMRRVTASCSQSSRAWRILLLMFDDDIYLLAHANNGQRVGPTTRCLTVHVLCHNKRWHCDRQAIVDVWVLFCRPMTVGVLPQHYTM